MKIKKLDYLIKLTYDKDYQGYVAEVVNLYGCMSQGKTKEEALMNNQGFLNPLSFLQITNTCPITI